MLIGFMDTSKTATGKIFAKKIQMEFFQFIGGALILAGVILVTNKGSQETCRQKPSKND
ncbi:hypothetical protein [Sporomusa sp.]|uniref:hypothetical protein n=1 Tax=Sporomusa sp. TaxID=2078658 RepID=UPI002D022F4C|nr:hypothetical protein [Sporomusa sp.]HWR44531.1 hypothetical protein [Sporomusa sp.]